MATIGILGVGHLAEYLVEGLRRGPVAHDIIVSPRNAAKAHSLADRFGVRVADSNQDVVDRCDQILVCLPTATGRDTLAELNFRPGQSVLSAMAGTSQSQLVPLVAPASAHVTMMPGAANAIGCGPCLLFPDLDEWRCLLSDLGPVVVLDSEAQFDIAAVFGGLSGASFAWMNALVSWFVDQGLQPDMAQQLVAATLKGNAEVVQQPGAQLALISTGVATPGGITRQVVDHLNDKEALAVWGAALDAVLARIKAD